MSAEEAPLRASEDAVAQRYARHLLDSLGLRPLRPLELGAEHPALSWARSGLMSLTGAADGEPQMCPAPLAACADGALAALVSLAPERTLEGLRGSQLLAERAAIAGHVRQGAISPGGSCRLLHAADGWIALNLAREDDWALLPAWLQADVAADWNSVTQRVAQRSANELVARGRELGLAVSAMQSFRSSSTSSVKEIRHARVGGNDGVLNRPPVVIELASLWAGPLCGHLLQLCGAEVIKVESTARPDGARRGPPQFFDLLNGGKRSVALDFATTAGREQLRALIRRADIVIEGSRPRALRQIGIEADALLTENPALTWISLSGYGRGEPQENWIAYGDDAAVDAGLSQLMFEATGQLLICGDAIADPLAGLHAALAAWAGFTSGGGRLIALSLSEVVRRCIQFDRPPLPAALRQRQKRWQALLLGAGVSPALPQARPALQRAPALGADNAAVRT